MYLNKFPGDVNVAARGPWDRNLKVGHPEEVLQNEVRGTLIPPLNPSSAQHLPSPEAQGCLHWSSKLSPGALPAHHIYTGLILLAGAGPKVLRASENVLLGQLRATATQALKFPRSLCLCLLHYQDFNLLEPCCHRCLPTARCFLLGLHCTVQQPV